ncbi:hypothetical protein AGMMS49991_10180 [Spirochaetia bacterium]|nr:hypothetical protein AGMMS49991_10180 [Spirochaetia bacterium]
MTNKKRLLFVLLPVLLFVSCGFPGSATIIRVSNNSSHNLRLDFKSRNLDSESLDERMLFTLDTLKNQSGSHKYQCNGNVAPDPNWDVQSITFVDLDSNETMAEKPAFGLGLFVFESREKLSDGGEDVVYSLTITDAMLEHGSPE